MTLQQQRKAAQLEMKQASIPENDLHERIRLLESQNEELEELLSS